MMSIALPLLDWLVEYHFFFPKLLFRCKLFPLTTNCLDAKLIGMRKIKMIILLWSNIFNLKTNGLKFAPLTSRI